MTNKKQQAMLREFRKKFGILIYAGSKTKMANHHLEQFLLTHTDQIYDECRGVLEDEQEFVDKQVETFHKTCLTSENDNGAFWSYKLMQKRISQAIKAITKLQKGE